MQESVIVKEWQEQAVARAQVENVLAILLKKHGAVPPEVEARIEATTDLVVLRRWVLLAAEVVSIDAFRRDAGI